MASTLGVYNPLRYRGYVYDQETGLYYLQSRYYNPEIGRFIQSTEFSSLDPSGINGLNLYSYANNNPVGITYKNSNIVGYLGGSSSSVSRNLPPVPGWVDTVSTALDHMFSVVNIIRTAGAISTHENLWGLMRIDGVFELPGILSKVATCVGWGLGIVGGAITGYEKYATGASLSSSIVGGLINAGINIGGMYAATGLASLGMGMLATTAIPGGVVVLLGVAGAIVIGTGINHIFTKMKIGGNTIEGHLNTFADWLIFWD